tara:strand:+ start:322 stop:894 length:573 start_codon:yes stop_codon:yes gene_type:complete
MSIGSSKPAGHYTDCAEYNKCLNRFKLIRNLLSYKHLPRITYMSRNKRIGYLAGVFDYCHKGHVRVIRRASKECDVLIVAVVSDTFASRYKSHKIRYNERHRLTAIKDLDIAHHVVIVDNNNHEPFYREYGVTHLFHGTDWEMKSYVDFMGREAIVRHNIQIVMLPHTPGISSSQLREKDTTLQERDETV